ncbi:MAG: hypothetical protein ABEI99_06760 [Halobaculum sp.]
MQLSVTDEHATETVPEATVTNCTCQVSDESEEDEEQEQDQESWEA